MADNVQPERKTSWLRQLRAGDERAFAEFVRKYEQMVFLCCRTLGLREDEADDVASETFVAAYQGLPKYAGRAKLSTWLLRITYNKAVTHLRKKKRHRQLSASLEKQLVDTYDKTPPAELENRQMCEILWQAVGRLPGFWAVAIVLFYREEKSIAEIAKIMKKRKNTVKTYLFRGRKRLKELLADTIGEDIYAG